MVMAFPIERRYKGCIGGRFLCAQSSDRSARRLLDSLGWRGDCLIAE